MSWKKSLKTSQPIQADFCDMHLAGRTFQFTLLRVQNLTDFSMTNNDNFKFPDMLLHIVLYCNINELEINELAPNHCDSQQGRP